MRIFLMFLLALPVLELLGFAAIGSKIGLGGSLAWIVGAIFAGSMVIKSAGTQSFKRVRAGESVILAPDLFDALCRLLAGVLLIFPGFISDFLALLCLVPTLRNGMFRFAQGRPFPRDPHDAAPPSSGGNKVIDGDYRRIDEE